MQHTYAAEKSILSTGINYSYEKISKQKNNPFDTQGANCYVNPQELSILIDTLPVDVKIDIKHQKIKRNC